MIELHLEMMISVSMYDDFARTDDAVTVLARPRAVVGCAEKIRSCYNFYP